MLKTIKGYPQNPSPDVKIEETSSKIVILTKIIKLKGSFNKIQNKGNLDKKNIEYLNSSFSNELKELKKVITSEKFKKNCNVAISVCRSKNNLIQIKDLYSLDNIIVGHIESPNANYDKKIISYFSKYFIFFEEMVEL